MVKALWLGSRARNSCPGSSVPLSGLLVLPAEVILPFSLNIASTHNQAALSFSFLKIEFKGSKGLPLALVYQSTFVMFLHMDLLQIFIDSVGIPWVFFGLTELINKYLKDKSFLTLGLTDIYEWKSPFLNQGPYCSAERLFKPQIRLVS